MYFWTFKQEFSPIFSQGMLKLATREKFHLRTSQMMEMIIALDSSFREVQFWYKDYLIMTRRNGILNLFSLMHKLSRSTSVKCRLMKPNRCVSSPSTKCINKSDLSLIWTSLISSHISFSLLSLLVCTVWRQPSLLHMSKRKANFWVCLLAENFRKT